MKNKIITYRVITSEGTQDDWHYGYQLNATTDEEARKEAAKVAKDKNWSSYKIAFFRESDQCHGQIGV